VETNVKSGFEIEPFADFRSWSTASRQQGLSRRDFLRGALGAGAATLAMKPRRLFAATTDTSRKTIIVTFGGGARDAETFSVEGQRNIPHMMQELAPQGMFFSQVVNRGILGHYVATSSIASGRYETFDNFVAEGPANPTLFEYYRKGLQRPAKDVWVIAPSNGFEAIGNSSHAAYGKQYGAQVILPKRLLTYAAATNNHTLRDYNALLHDSYESPYHSDDAAQDAAAGKIESEEIAKTLKLSLDEFTAHSRTLTSPDELSLFITRQVMREVAPSLLFITLHDIDVAHSGAYSLYLDAIQRADRLCAELWQEVETNPEYKDRTTVLIMPDFGRDADGEGNGFQHHRTGSPMARTTWMLALGKGTRPGTIVSRPVESIDLTPTVASLYGIETPFSMGRPIAELL
jgi:uncharacterized protein (DUF1501 family)